MDRHDCYLSMGSNASREANLEMARRELGRLFPDIRFSSPEDTEPLGAGFKDRFLNQTAHFTTGTTAAEVRRALKELERKAGRRPEDKPCGIVRLDLDLLTYDGEVCKPEDLKRDFVRRGLECLGCKIEF